jgi:hypothetical protein
MILFLGKLGRNFLRAQFKGIARRDQWNIGVVDEPIHRLLDTDERPVVHWLPQRGSNRYLADPFPISRGDDVTVLAEDFDYRTRKGRISCVSVRPDGSVQGGPRPVLDLDVHVSYPFVFQHAGAWFCVPESVRSRHVAIYRSADGGRTWEHQGSLIDDFAAVDPTVFRHGGRWWLLCTDGDRGPNGKLHAWYATDLLGPWQTHATNPLKTDVRSSRPGGTPFVHEGVLFRPAQDDSQTYGGRVVLNRVTRLTPTEFAEDTVAVVEPDRECPWPDGLHTISAAGEMTLIDGKRSRFIWPAFRHELGARLMRRGAAATF